MKSHAVVKRILFCLSTQSQCSNTRLLLLCARWLQACECFLSYKTVVRPSYKVVYRTVTSLEWKCCPGFSGPACEEGESKHAHKTHTAPNARLGPFKGADAINLRLLSAASSFASVFLPPLSIHPRRLSSSLIYQHLHCLLLIRSLHRNTLKAGVVSIRLT